MFAGLAAEEYYGPPRPGQSFAQYESFMSMPIVGGASGVIIGALIAGPIGAIAGGIGGWILNSGGSSDNRSKPTTQGG